MTDGFLLTKWLLAATLSGISLLPIPAPSIPVKNLPGGYSAVGLTDDVKAAAEFAVQEQAKREAVVLKLSDISKAERQIVAGVNEPCRNVYQQDKVRQNLAQRRVLRDQFEDSTLPGRALFLDFAVLLQELVEQHRVHCFVAHRS